METFGGDAMSRQRRVIMDIINGSCEHMTAQEIYEKARQRIPNISVGTVYRNLGQLAEEHQIFRIIAASGPDRYDKNVHLHGHFICDCCGSVRDLPCPDFSERIEREFGVKVNSYQLSVYYICEKCKAARCSKGA
jgi:Fe2+ or Zn2+ uptake regulation protein